MSVSGSHTYTLCFSRLMHMHPLVVETCLFAIVSYRGQDGSQGLEAHGNIQQVSSKEKVVVMAQNRHGGVPDQVEERLHQKQRFSDE